MMTVHLKKKKKKAAITIFICKSDGTCKCSIMAVLWQTNSICKATMYVYLLRTLGRQAERCGPLGNGWCNFPCACVAGASD